MIVNKDDGAFNLKPSFLSLRHYILVAILVFMYRDQLDMVGAEVQVEHIRLTPRVESAWFQLFESTYLSSRRFQIDSTCASPTAWRRCLGT